MELSGELKMTSVTVDFASLSSASIPEEADVYYCSILDRMIRIEAAVTAWPQRNLPFTCL